MSAPRRSREVHAELPRTLPRPEQCEPHTMGAAECVCEEPCRYCKCEKP